MESVEWIVGFKSSDGFILPGGKIIPLPALPVMHEDERIGEVKWKSEKIE